MSALTGHKIKDSYGDVLQMSHGGAGADATQRHVYDGLGHALPVEVSTDSVTLYGAGETNIISTDYQGGGQVVIDSSANIQIGVSTPVLGFNGGVIGFASTGLVDIVVGTTAKIRGGDRLELNCTEVAFFGATGSGQRAAPAGGTDSDRITAIEAALVAYGLMAAT